MTFFNELNFDAKAFFLSLRSTSQLGKWENSSNSWFYDRKWPDWRIYGRRDALWLFGSKVKIKVDHRVKSRKSFKIQHVGYQKDAFDIRKQLLQQNIQFSFIRSKIIPSRCYLQLWQTISCRIWSYDAFDTHKPFLHRIIRFSVSRSKVRT